MKLAKHSLFKVLIISSLVIALTGCDAILGKLLPQAEAAYPDISFEGGSETLHYGDEKTLTVTASVTDGGSLSYQWYKGTENDRDKASAISGANKVSYTITAPNEEVAETYYWCKVTNSKNGKTESAWTSAYAITVSNIIRLAGDFIEDNTEWNSNYTYFLSNWVAVKNELTIPAGTVVKLGENVYFETSGDGILIASGTEEKPVIFTSYRDNTVGIKIPEYKDSSVAPKAGDWKNVIILGAQGSSFEYCVFRYGGGHDDGLVGSVLEIHKQSSVRKCLFTNNKSYDTIGALYLEVSEDDGTQVAENIFYNNEWPLTCPVYFTLDPSNIFHKPGDETVKNKYQAITMRWNDDIGGINDSLTTEWNVTGIPYYFTSDWITVKGTLNIGDGVVVKFNNGAYLNTSGNGKIEFGDAILTSRYDDEHGGDIDGSTTGPRNGNWQGVCLGATNDSYEYDGWANEINMDTEHVLYNDKTKFGQSNNKD